MTGKTYDYILVIKPDANLAYYDWISRIMIFIGIINLGYTVVALRPSQEQFIGSQAQYIAGGLCLAAIVTWIYAEIRTGTFRLPLFLIFLGWLYPIWNILIALLYAIVGILEKQVKFRREFGFDEEGITVNSFPRKRYKWHEVNNVVLKDGIITVDLYNNRIMQKELDDESTTELEKEFNEFCRSHLLSV